MMDITHVPVRELLPHEPPMVLLDRIVSFGAATLVAEVDIREDSQFCAAGGVPGWVGIEYMAQAVAAHAGCEARERGDPPSIGYLLGTRAYRCNIPTFPVGATLRITVESLFVEMQLGAYACNIETHVPVASATINVFRPQGGMLENDGSGRIS